MHSMKFIFIAIFGWLLLFIGNYPFAAEPLMVLQIYGVPGEYPNEPYLQWIEVSNFQHGIDGPISAGENIIPSQHKDFSITKKLDCATPLINLLLCNGQELGKITFVYLDGMGFQETYILNNVRIISSAIEAAPDSYPAEVVSFRYKEIHWQLSEYDSMGIPQYTEESWWNIDSHSGDTTSSPPNGFPPDTGLFEWSLY